jgi:hypothetical protein
MPGNLHGKQMARPIPIICNHHIILVTFGIDHAWKPVWHTDGKTNSDAVQQHDTDNNNLTLLCL